MFVPSISLNKISTVTFPSLVTGWGLAKSSKKSKHARDCLALVSDSPLVKFALWSGNLETGFKKGTESKVEDSEAPPRSWQTEGKLLPKLELLQFSL